MKYCSTCGAEIREGWAFCSNCGAEVAYSKESRINISRESSIIGVAGTMYCYANDELIAKVKNGESVTCKIEADTVDFRCNIPLGTLSDVYTLNMCGREVIRINVKVGALKPQIKIMDSNAIINIRTVNGQDKSKNAVVATTTAMSPTDETNKKPFAPTKKVGEYFAVDENAKQWAIGRGIFPSLKNVTPFAYSDIVDFELLEDGSSVSKGGLGRAIVGGALFGVGGAIVGGVTGKKKVKQTCTSLMIKITVRNTINPVEYIKFITSSTAKDGILYKSSYQLAQEVMSLLQIITNQQEASSVIDAHPVSMTQQTSAADEIRKYKSLLDDGIISQEEFETKKKQLLGL